MESNPFASFSFTFLVHSFCYLISGDGSGDGSGGGDGAAATTSVLCFALWWWLVCARVWPLFHIYVYVYMIAYTLLVEYTECKWYPSIRRWNVWHAFGQIFQRYGASKTRIHFTPISNVTFRNVYIVQIYIFIHVYTLYTHTHTLIHHEYVSK